MCSIGTKDAPQLKSICFHKRNHSRELNTFRLSIHSQHVKRTIAFFGLASSDRANNEARW
jgi:hypothetical protein